METEGLLDALRLDPVNGELVRARLAQELEKRAGYKLHGYFRDSGPLRRALYPKHMAFVELGLEFRERCFLAANRVGKTDLGAYEVSCHLTGEYPAWWSGKRYTRPVKGWAAGDTKETVRGILQVALLGEQGQYGTGMLPANRIKHVSHKQGASGAVDIVWVHHVSGGHSVLEFRSYDQGRRTFQGTGLDFVWLDEEPPHDIYEECLMRTMTTNGMVLATFTPLMGITPLILEFMGGAELTGVYDDHLDLTDGKGGPSSKVLVKATWDDVPHLSDAAKTEYFNTLMPHQRQARSKGIPELGAGAIYPVDPKDFTVTPFTLPAFWPRVYGLDVGWNNTASVHGAWDREHDILYLYAAYKRGQAEPASHAAAIKLHGDWIPGVCDPAGNTSNQIDGRKLLSEYRKLGLNLQPADNAVESGLFAVYTRLSTGRLKVFGSLGEWFAEYAMYRRGKDGKPVKEHDHLMDATRYLVLSGLDRAMTAPVEPEQIIYAMPGSAYERSLGWMS